MPQLQEVWFSAAIGALQTVILIAFASRVLKCAKLWRVSAVCAAASYALYQYPELTGTRAGADVSVIFLLLYVFFFFLCFDEPLNKSLFLEVQVRLANFVSMLCVRWVNVLLGKADGLFWPRSAADAPRTAFSLALLLALSAAASYLLSSARLGSNLPYPVRGVIVALFQLMSLPLERTPPHGYRPREAAQIIFEGMLVFGVALAVIVAERAGQSNARKAEEEQRRLQMAYYRSLSDVLDEFRCLRHDLNNYLAVQQHLPGGQDGLISTMRETAERFCDVELSSNPYLNAVLYEKRRRANELGVRLVCDCRLTNEAEIPVASLVSIACNLLDNALEACGRDDEVRLWAVVDKGLCVIRVMNPLHGRELPHLRRIVRSPKGAGHGVGLRSVRRACEDNGGAFTLSQESGMAVATASIACAPRGAAKS